MMMPRGADDEITMVRPSCGLFLLMLKYSGRIITHSIGAASINVLPVTELKISDRVWFRPRILRNVANIDYSSTILGFKTSMPVYITATALGE